MQCNKLVLMFWAKVVLIAKQTKGRSFSGLLNYLLSKEGAMIVGGNMIGQSAKELTKEFSASRKLKPSLNRVVYHASLSLPPGESLSDKKWQEISNRYTKEMGFKNSQFVAVKHTDTQHSHIHIVASRISMDGRVVSDSHDYKRSESIVRSIEKDYRLSRVCPSRESQARAPKSGELHKALRENEPSTRMVLKNAIDQARTNRPTMSEFVHRLNAAGVSVVPNVAKTGTITGLSFEVGGEKMKGSDIGRGYTWKNLQKRGVNYEQTRDFRTINESRNESAVDGRLSKGVRQTLSSGSVESGRLSREGEKAHERIDSNVQVRAFVDKWYDLSSKLDKQRFKNAEGSCDKHSRGTSSGSKGSSTRSARGAQISQGGGIEHQETIGANCNSKLENIITDLDQSRERDLRDSQERDGLKKEDNSKQKEGQKRAKSRTKGRDIDFFSI